jgi:hypothetical protein
MNEYFSAYKTIKINCAQAKEVERLNQTYKNIMKNAGVELVGEEAVAAAVSYGSSGM